VLAALLAIVIGQATIGSAQAAQTVSVVPSAPTSGNEFPFGRTDLWPNLLWVYKNVPAFDLKAGDTISFDLQAMNDVSIDVAIAMAPATTNGGDVPAAGLTQVVPNTELPANSLGNTITGDYELTFTSQSAFHFPGGGLIMQIGQPAGAFTTDSSQDTVFLNNLAKSTDASDFFVKRIVGAAASYPWGGTAIGDYIAGFRLNILDVPPPAAPPTPPSATPKKKCKKKHKRAAVSAKKCKKKRR
jgi:hypothetical protein